jgi:hypothetical protein
MLWPARNEWLKNAPAYVSVETADAEARQRAAKRKVRHVERTSRAILVGARKCQYLGWVDASLCQRRPILPELDFGQFRSVGRGGLFQDNVVHDAGLDCATVYRW